MITRVKDIKVGECFKLSSKKRKFHRLKKKINLKEPLRFKGMILLVTDDCKTIALKPETKLIKL